MIFAELEYDQHYDYLHNPLLKLVKANFKKVESGQQGDSWIWVFDGDLKVAIDTFSSMKHQVKSENGNNPLVLKVVDVLKTKYRVIVFDKPKLEAHE